LQEGGQLQDNKAGLLGVGKYLNLLGIIGVSQKAFQSWKTPLASVFEYANESGRFNPLFA
jgi:hypothetical protein